MKILNVDISKDENELSKLIHLSESVRGLNHLGKAHVIELLAYFEHDGPDGTHLRLVLPVMITDAAAMIVTGKPHQVGCIQAVSKQVSWGLDLLHTLDIVHCGRLALQGIIIGIILT